MELYEHGGNIHKALRDSKKDQGELLDFSANINPLGPPPWTRAFCSRNLGEIEHYPDPEYHDLIEAVARATSQEKHGILVANGTTELLYTYMRTVPCGRVVLAVPSYVDYEKSAALAGKKTAYFTLKEEDHFHLDFNRFSNFLEDHDLVVLGSPNNPTGQIISLDEIKRLAINHPKSQFLLDEAFLDFSAETASAAGKFANVSTLNSMTKFYGVPGLRLGYGIFPGDLAAAIKKQLLPWSVNALAQGFGIKALADTCYQEKSEAFCTKLRNELFKNLSLIPELKVFEGAANYLLLKLRKGTGAELYAHCKDHGILIRRCDNYRGFRDKEAFIRVAVRSSGENKKLIAVLESFFGKKRKTAKDKTTPAIMFQGTCSDAGKSILTAALCRILYQDGVDVAPFKAQNMSLNSFVTLAGKEMGRAQVVQAMASGLAPDHRMNPILLKPNSDTGSQVIVEGVPEGNMTVLQYSRYKKDLWPRVTEVYNSLAAEHQVVVLEGAGSPGEVNLKKDDIVNMRMAQYAKAPVLLIGDIDRGGVYASFVGIMEVLEEWERRLVAGFVVNKFRGQASLLQSAHDYVFSHTGKQVLGVVPYLQSLGLPEEDSVSFKKGSFNSEREGEHVEIVLINLPHISNFTDIEPFLQEPDVAVRVIDQAQDLGRPDCVILPGSKNVIHDLSFVKDRGFADALISYVAGGGTLVGICGGYQFLGKSIADPHGIESSLGEISGLGLLEMATVIEKEKNLTRKAGTHRPSGKNVVGYEIHHGISDKKADDLILFDDGSGCGIQSIQARVWGSYLHGIFDADEFRRWFIDDLRITKGLAPLGSVQTVYDLEEGFTRLADTVRKELDMDSIYGLLGI